MNVVSTLTPRSDAAVTMGMVLLCEAATSDIDIGKRKSMCTHTYSTSKSKCPRVAADKPKAPNVVKESTSKTF